MPKKTIETIVESGNDYVIQVKGNAPKLNKWIKNSINQTLPYDMDYTKEKSRDRIEQRACYVYRVEGQIEGYQSCKTIIQVVNSGFRGAIKYKENHLYISNKTTMQARYFLEGIRGHWSIENSCHWVKDAILQEDNSRVSNMDLGENLSTLRHLIINIYRLNNYKSIKKAIEKHCNRLDQSLLLINSLCI